MTNLVIGSGYNLNWNQIAVWAKSLRASGYKDDAILVYFGHNSPLFQLLYDYDISVALFPDLNLAHNVCVDRFAAYHALLASAPNKYDWVLATDVTDVVFQKDPMLHLAEVEQWQNGVVFYASSENLTYEHEPWGQNNLILSFGGETYSHMMGRTIYNAGVIAAKHSRMTDISNLIWNMCVGRPQHVFGGGGPDQAAYNVLLNATTFHTYSAYATHDNGWVCQCGTTLDPNKPYYKDHMIDPVPSFDGTNVVTSTGEPYHIVHQYNRVPALKEHFERKYNV